MNQDIMKMVIGPRYGTCYVCNRWMNADDQDPLGACKSCVGKQIDLMIEMTESNAWSICATC